jgi:hypothetical protein
LDLNPETQEQSDRMILFCWVFDDPRAFPIDIGPEKTVGELKKAIVAENPNRFRGIDAYLLNLWKKLSLLAIEVGFGHRTSRTMMSSMRRGESASVSKKLLKKRESTSLSRLLSRSVV